MQNLRTSIPTVTYSHFGSFSNKCTKGKKMPLKSDTITYLFSFNGKEKDNETYGDGNEYDYGFRIYNPRIGRFLSVDPLTEEYPWYTPYQFAGNDAIRNIDRDGLEPEGYEYRIRLFLEGKTGLGLINFGVVIHAIEPIGLKVEAMKAEASGRLYLELTESGKFDYGAEGSGNDNINYGFGFDLMGAIGKEFRNRYGFFDNPNSAYDETKNKAYFTEITNKDGIEDPSSWKMEFAVGAEANFFATVGVKLGIEISLKKKQTESTKTPVNVQPQNPNSKNYVVKKSDTLSAIAKKNKTSVSKLVELNGIKDKDKIEIGQTIKLK
jgi:RHS repeat-associated protein